MDKRFVVSEIVSSHSKLSWSNKFQISSFVEDINLSKYGGADNSKLNQNQKYSTAFCRAGNRFWLEFIVDKALSLSWCAAVIDQINFSHKVVLPARVNKTKREFASKDLVGG